MSSKNFASNATSASSKDAKKKVVTEKSLYDLWRPQPGIRFQLSQTAIDFNAAVPKVKLKYTRVSYEPGQDLSVPSDKPQPKQYAKQRGRKPVFKFQEEIDEKRRKIKQKLLAARMIEQSKKTRRLVKLAVKAIHDEIMYAIGPKWFHELSGNQMRSADALKEAMEKDCRFNTIINTQETLGQLGLQPWPNHTKVEYCLKKFNQCPVEFLLSLIRLNNPKEPGKIHEYTLNDRIMLSAVVHLSMREILRELHLRIPCPATTEEHPGFREVQRRVRKIRNRKKHKKWKKSMSPYLNPLVPVTQKHVHEVYKNRHKEYASLDYFDYIDDMYNIYFVDDPESVKKRKQAARKRGSKWTRPPKIPVRYIESKMKKKKIYELKKPSPYLSPCQKLKSMYPDIEPLPVPEEEIVNIDTNLCRCSPGTFTEDTVFDLKIKITTSEDELLLVQKLCPYNSKNSIGDLNLIQQTKKGKDSVGKCMEDETGKAVKRIEYSCICCTCGKLVNICPTEDPACPAIPKINNFKEIIKDLNTIPEEDEEAFEDYEPERKISDICKCISKSSSSLSSTDSEDPYGLCTCKSSSSSCTCCICDQMNKDFLLKIKRYNEVHKTNYQPCLCLCKCKKYKKKKGEKKQDNDSCYDSDEKPCKYCFCTKKKAIVEEEEIEEEEEMEEEEKAEEKSEGKVEEKGGKKGEDKGGKKVEKGGKKVEEKAEKKGDKKGEKIAEKKEELKKIEAVKSEEQPGLNKQPSKLKSTGFKSTIEFFGTKAGDKDACSCEHLYTKYLTAHESCMSLFEQYQKKLEKDLEEYVQDMKYNRCLCGDSDNSSSKEMMEDEDIYIHEDIPSLSSEETCPKTCVNCRCGFQGCTCNEYGVDFSGCICNTSTISSSESSDNSTSSGSSNPCCCTCKEVTCECAKVLEQVRVAKEAKRIKEEEEKAEAARKELEEMKNKKKEWDDDLDSEEGEEKIEEIDPRVIVLERFPTKKKEQMELLKRALGELAADGYPLAKLPEVYRLPHFQIWFNMRCGKYISMEERNDLYSLSKKYWGHLEVCERNTDLPPAQFSPEKIHNLRWDAVNTYHKMISRVRADFHRKVKRRYIDQGQEFFPSTCHYLLPNKTFRDTYFSYLPSDENHIFVFKPWLISERKDMSSRKPCL